MTGGVVVVLGKTDVILQQHVRGRGLCVGITRSLYRLCNYPWWSWNRIPEEDETLEIVGTKVAIWKRMDVSISCLI